MTGPGRKRPIEHPMGVCLEISRYATNLEETIAKKEMVKFTVNI